MNYFSVVNVINTSMKYKKRDTILIVRIESYLYKIQILKKKKILPIKDYRGY